jgi:hypothetical protein
MLRAFSAESAEQQIQGFSRSAAFALDWNKKTKALNGRHNSLH